jgi:hypothetical protein
MVFLRTNAKSIALVIGINYIGTSAALNGCIQDTEHIHSFLTKRVGVRPSNITVLTDNTHTKPTRNNIERALRTVLRRVQSEGFEQVWFSYSGHGTHVQDRNGDDRRTVGDKDGRDEALVPLDYRRRGVITDDYLYQCFVRRLPKQVTMVSLVDACHSGTALDLPYVYRSDTHVVETNRSVRDVQRLAKVLKISGCRDSQTSADAHIGGTYQGAMTSTFLKMLRLHRYNIGSKALIEHMVRFLGQNRFNQIPTLSTTAIEYLNEPFMGCTDSPTTTLRLKGDSWSHSETRWNIRSSTTGEKVYKDDVELGVYKESLEVDVHLEAGEYTLELFDDYGDGGVVGDIVDARTGRKMVGFVFSTGTHMATRFVVDEENPKD